MTLAEVKTLKLGDVIYKFDSSYGPRLVTVTDEPDHGLQIDDDLVSLLYLRSSCPDPFDSNNVWFPCSLYYKTYEKCDKQYQEYWSGWNERCLENGTHYIW